MSLYNGLFEASKAMKAGFGNLKEKKGLLRQMANSAKESEAVKSAGPALGKLAKHAAYPAGIGAGIGVGAYAAGAGSGAGAEAAGVGIKKGWAPEDVADAGKSFFGVLMLFVVLAGAYALYRQVKP